MRALATVIVLSVVFLANTDSRAQRPGNENPKLDRMVFDAIQAGLFQSDFFRTEIGLTTEQKHSLDSLISQFEKRHREALLRLNSSYAKELLKTGVVKDQTVDDYRAVLASLSGELRDSISESLLPHQVERFEQVLRQRREQFKFGMYPFDFPLTVSGELGLSKSEQQLLKDTTVEERKIYGTHIADLKKKLLSKQIEELPDDFRSKIHQVLGSTYYQTAEYFGQPLTSDELLEIKQMGAEYFWNRIEFARLNDVVGAARSDPKLIMELGISDPQREQLKLLGREYSERERQHIKQQGSIRLEIAILEHEGKTEEAVELRKKITDQYDSLRGQYRKKVFDNVLLPIQIHRAKQIAKQMRLRQQAAENDEFGVVALLAGELDLPDSQQKKMEKRAAALRDEYFEKLIQLRSEAYDRILDVLPSKCKRRFDEFAGDPYDLLNELVEKLRHQKPGSK